MTQNDPVAVAFGTAAALILEAVVRGASVAAAVASTIDWLLQQAAEQQQQAGQQAGGAAVEPVPGSLWAEVAARLLQAAELAPLPPLEAAAQLGRNCHLPNSLQTPLQVVLHLEYRHAQQAQQAQQQLKVVKTLKPLAEGQPYVDGAATASAPSPTAAPGAGGSGHGPGGSAHGGAGGMPRIRSLSQMQEHMSRAYHGNAGSGSESHEGTRHSHVSWADEAGKA